MSKTRILHITPHLGGGVGQVLLNYLSFDKINCHSIATLEHANEKALKIAQKESIAIYSSISQKLHDLLLLIKNTDIVIVHFWNHPLLYSFLLKNPLPPARVIFWSHISGFDPPYVFPPKILDYPDKFVFTTPLSFNTQEIREFYDKNKLAVVFSTGGINHVKDISPQPHTSFNIGYIGTVDYAKMHPDFINVHKKTNIPNVKFIIVGGDNEKEIAQAADERFEFTGKVPDIRPYLSKMDVFGYLLSEKHYGTGEQVLQEAMSVGVVPVVLNNPIESLIVKHGETGLVAKNTDEYIKYIELLYFDDILRKNLSQNAKAYANTNFSLNILCSKWNAIYNEIIKMPKKERQYSKKTDYRPAEIFLESLGKYHEPFSLYLEKGDVSLLEGILKQPQWSSETKGTPKHYYQFFNDDLQLKKIIDLYR